MVRTTNGNNTKTGYCGLKNLSATCYINSFLQQLFNIPPIRQAILSINIENKESTLYQLQVYILFYLF